MRLQLQICLVSNIKIHVCYILSAIVFTCCCAFKIFVCEVLKMSSRVVRVESTASLLEVPCCRMKWKEVVSHKPLKVEKLLFLYLYKCCNEVSPL